MAAEPLAAKSVGQNRDGVAGYDVRRRLGRPACVALERSPKGGWRPTRRGARMAAEPLAAKSVGQNRDGVAGR